ncbi:MAG: hypothetical protein J1G01_05355 [Clostridiales bacterium]|nr:hypothetical protein [Clostridiales bacterium]
MKYIDKEYGFEPHPPISDNYKEKPSVDFGDENYPGRYIIGAGYDYGAINGAMLVGKHGSMWGIRVQYHAGTKWLDSDDFVKNIGSECANTADGSFARFSSGPLCVKWARYDDRSLVLQVSSTRKLRVRVVFYPCYDCPGELSIVGDSAMGRSPYMAVIPETNEQAESSEFQGRKLVKNDEAREFFRAVSYVQPSRSESGAPNEASMEFVISHKCPSVAVFACMGDLDIYDAELPQFDKIQELIESSERSYADNKTYGEGELGSPIERMYSAVLWSRVYYPHLFTEIFSPKRTELDNRFDLDGTEENCAAILGCYTGAMQAAKQLKYTLEDKIMAVFAVWHNYMHLSDKLDLLAEYRKLSKLYPPIASPVISEKDKGEVAYRWSDSPLKEKFNRAPMYSLDLSSLKLFAFDVLERIASLFDLPDRAKYALAKNSMQKIINETFWCESEGMYLNRYTTGQWANAVGATSFYPLLAGAVDTPEKLSRIVNMLTDTKKFWGDYAIPTLSKNNREYGKRSKPNDNGKCTLPYLEFRGSILPYVNFIVYHGLKRYGLDEIASAVAQKSAVLWSVNASDTVQTHSVYLPSGKRMRSGEYLSANGNMLALIGMQDLIDIEYFRPDLKHAIAFGTFARGNNSATNVELLDSSYSIEVTDESTALIMDDIELFNGAGGKFVVRNFTLDGKGGGEFMINAWQNITINLNLPSEKKKTVKYFLIVPPGMTVVKAVGGMVSIEKLNEL